MASMSEIRNWWKIPCIVHFCDIFNPIFNNISRINIEEFEKAVVENSILLTDITKRFASINQWAIKSVNNWWKTVKVYIQKYWQDKNYAYSLDSAENFDEMTSRQKVEVIYVLCSLMFELEQPRKIFLLTTIKNPKIISTLNLKPLGYDVKNSVYWYFGNDRLYREEFETVPDFFPESLKSLLFEPYPSEFNGTGKWFLICDGYESWSSLAATFKHSKNINEIALLKSIMRIIENLANLKNREPHYTFYDLSLTNGKSNP